MTSNPEYRENFHDTEPRRETALDPIAIIDASIVEYANRDYLDKEETTNIGLDILNAYIRRYEFLGFKDKIEEQKAHQLLNKLLKWVSEGGVKSLQDVVDHLLDIRTALNDLYQLDNIQLV